VISPDSVVTSGLGGSPTVTISGSGPYVVVVSGISLAPSASGTITLKGMVADVGLTGSTYTDNFYVYSLDDSASPQITGDANNPLAVTVNVATGTATYMDHGMEPKATFVNPTFSASKLVAVVTATAAAGGTGSDVTIIVAGRDSTGASLIGRATILSGSTTSTTPVDITLFDGSTTPTNWARVEAVYIRTTQGVIGDKFKLRAVQAAMDVVTDIETKDSTAGTLIAGQSINLAAFVTDNSGKGVSGVPVTFSTYAASTTEVTGGSFTATTVTTDALGVARTIFTTSTTQGTQTIKATSPGLIGSGTTYKITTVWGPAARLVVTASPDSIPAVGGSSTITAMLVDANGNTRKVAGVSVAFGTTAGQLSDKSATTGSDGKASVVLSATSTTTAGTTALVTATAAGLTGSVQVSFTTGPIASVSVSVSPSSIRILEEATVTATVKDANGNPIQGATVTFAITITGGFVTYQPTMKPSSAVTGPDGTATSKFVASIEAGTATVTAAAGGFTATTGTITVSGGTPVKLEGSATQTTIPADGTSTTTITFTLEDKYGNTVLPSAAIPVTITTTAGTLSSTTDTISTATGSTSGVTLKSSTTVGKVTVTATGGGYTGSVTVTFAGAASDFKMTAQPSIVQVNNPTTITIQLIDAAGNNAINTGTAAISFEGTATSGTLALPISSINPGSSSTQFTWTAPSSVPPGGTATITVTATLKPGVTITRQVQVQVAGAPYKISLTATPTTAPADGTTIVEVVAKLVDVSGVTIVSSPGITIQFSTDLGTLLTTSVNTDTTTGEAKAYLKAPTTTGKATITAVGGGVAGSTTIEFTTPGPVYKAEVKTPTLVDTAGRTVTAPRAGAIVAISSPIVNKQDVAQQTLYIVQVKDSTGAIVSFNFVSGTIPANTELTFAIGWRPTAPGTYTIEVFAWNNFTEAQVLAPMQTITINVA
jgi:adhesin/invasin